MLRYAFASSVMALLSVLAGCGSTDPSPAASHEAGDSGTQTTTQPALPTTCGLSNAQIMLPPSHFGIGSPISGMLATKSYLTYSAFDEPYWLPISGGQPTLIPDADSSGYEAAKVIGSDFVLASPKEVIRVPIAGGTAVHEPLPDYCSYLRTFSADGSRLYCAKWTTFDTTINLWYYDLNTKQSVTLLDSSTVGVQDSFALSGDTIYIRETQKDGTRNRLFKVPTSGGPEVEVPIVGDFVFEIIGSGADGLYLGAAPISDKTGMGGIYRLGFDGGTPEKLVDIYLFAVTETCSVSVSNGNTYLLIPGEVYKVPPFGEANGLDIGCFPFAIATNDDNLFVSVQVSNNDEYEILRLPI